MNMAEEGQGIYDRHHGLTIVESILVDSAHSHSDLSNALTAADISRDGFVDLHNVWSVVSIYQRDVVGVRNGISSEIVVGFFGIDEGDNLKENSVSGRVVDNKSSSQTHLRVAFVKDVTRKSGV